jgi:hypothetical protein
MKGKASQWCIAGIAEMEPQVLSDAFEDSIRSNQLVDCPGLDCSTTDMYTDLMNMIAT